MREETRRAVTAGEGVRPEAPLAAPSTAGPRRLLNRNVVLLWQGQTISQLGTQAFDIALLLWLKHATESATIMGSILMVSGIAAVLLGPVAGIVVDRVSRRRILIASDAVLGVATLAVGALMYHAPQAKGAIIAALFAVALTTAVAGAFFQPAISAVLPDLAPKDKVNAANSLFQSTYQLATFLGQGLGGTLFRLLGAPLLFLFNGASYLYAALCESFIQVPPPPQVAAAATWRDALGRFRRDLLEGFRHIWQRPGLRNLVIASAALTFFTVPVMLLMPFFVEDFLKAKDDWYGFILAGYGAGALVGYVLAGAFRIPPRVRALLMMGAMIGEALGYVALGMVRSREVALALAMAGGVVSGFFMVYVSTLLQVTTPSEIRGRVFALLQTISGGLAPIAMGLTGVVADLLHHDVPFIFVLCGGCAGAVAIAVSLSGAFREYLAFDTAAAVAQADAAAARQA